MSNELGWSPDCYIYHNGHGIKLKEVLAPEAPND